MKNLLLAVSVMVGTVLLMQCKSTEPDNPYDNVTVVDGTIDLEVDLIPEGNFAWLHAKVFAPTCANSGCHDGSFEPHFSTVSASYNTLVNHPVIANDESFSFEYRVVPGNVSASMLFERMITEIPNTSGMMPLVVDAGSDWNEKREDYLAAISTWINSGAPDMFGNLPNSDGADLPPQVVGLKIFPAGNTDQPYQRDPESVGVSPILVPAAALDIWVAVTDDHTSPENLSVNELRKSEDVFTVDDTAPIALVTGNTITGAGFADQEVTFYHKASVDLTGITPGTVFFLRTYFNDGVQPNTTVIPNDGSSPVMTSLFTIQIQ